MKKVKSIFYMQHGYQTYKTPGKVSDDFKTLDCVILKLLIQ